MALRKRRSLLSGRSGPGEDNSPESGEETGVPAPDGDPPEPPPAPGPARVPEPPAEPVIPPYEEPPPEEPPVEEPEPETPPYEEPPYEEPPAEDPWAPPATGQLAPSGFVEEEPAAEDPWGAPTSTKKAGPTALEVQERNGGTGALYTAHGRRHDDTTDSGWGNNAFRGDPQPSLPPGWDTSDLDDDKPAPPSAWGATRKAAAASDIFGGDEEPPTEEQPAAVYEDRAPMYSAPMNVPEPPPIPGLFGDRFTPPPPMRGKEFNPASAGGARPRYEATPKPAPAAASPQAAPEPKPLPKVPSKPKAPEEDDSPRGGLPVVLLAGVAAVAGGVLVVGALVLSGALGGPSTPPPVATKVELPPPPPAPVADTDTDEAEAAATPATTLKPLAPIAAPTPKDPKPKNTGSGQRVPEDIRKEVKASNSPLSKGTLKIRSNRRVLVKINGQAKDYTPLDLPADPGKYTVTAALPGKPDSEQTFSIDLKSGSMESVNFSF